MTLGRWNEVRGCPGWHYGLRLRQTDGSVVFDASHQASGWIIRGLCGSVYRTTTLARRMGVNDLRGYQHVAVAAIRGEREGEG